MTDDTERFDVDEAERIIADAHLDDDLPIYDLAVRLLAEVRRLQGDVAKLNTEADKLWQRGEAYRLKSKDLAEEKYGKGPRSEGPRSEGP